MLFLILWFYGGSYIWAKQFLLDPPAIFVKMSSLFEQFCLKRDICHEIFNISNNKSHFKKIDRTRFPMNQTQAFVLIAASVDVHFPFLFQRLGSLLKFASML